ncbi:HK97 gp10 family phage protein [Schaalia sp.]|uniref:HK97 gp10 family phage protein n=1 Tax=Schaalia sp. TaxID=2691890 RepID=UPI003D0A07FE
MADGPLVTVDGARELRRQLKAAGDDLSDLKATHQRVARIAADGAEALAPVRTGRLRQSIRSAGTKTAAIVRVGKKSVPYAHAIQWGRKIWPSARGPQPNPPRHKHPSVILPSLFATQGAKATEPKWVAEYMNAVDKALATIEGDPS